MTTPSLPDTLRALAQNWITQRTNPLTLKELEGDFSIPWTELKALLGEHPSGALSLYLANGYTRHEDQALIRNLIKKNDSILRGFAAQGTAAPIWMSSAGDPGAGKTTLLLQQACERYGVQTNPEDWQDTTQHAVIRKLEQQGRVAVISADRALVQIARTLGVQPDNPAFYLKWRAASNAIALSKMATALDHKIPVVHDTTLGSAGALENLRYAQGTGYGLQIFVVAASNDVAAQSIDNRVASGYYQCLPANIEGQRHGFNANIPSIRALLRHGDQMTFFWRPLPDVDAQMALTAKPGPLHIIHDWGAMGALSTFLPATHEITQPLPRMARRP